MRADIVEVAAWLNGQGYMINNCFQLDGGTWRVNVRRRPGFQTDKDWGHEFAEAASLSGALRVLVERLGGEVEPEAVMPTRTGAMLDNYATALARATAILDARA